MLDQSKIDMTNAEEIVHAVAEELYEQGLISSVETLLAPSARADYCKATYLVAGDAMAIVAEVYSAPDPSTNVPGPGWSVSAHFESSRAPLEGADSWAQDDLAEFVEQVRVALA
ncbi:hypothetical protein MUG78_17855 [Gordonia alkaliphila]|uniref:hypothetical protein n=1 Tax=Gordonia alkaliphila TaxID=1053547 RepID=UPI001FF128CD|nr:hypothetical protein [Gordonia alkaliphila]MCK0441267.1 hypothetical protein [Gordonia alkaliphila]